MRIIRESLYNFHKTGDIKASLGIGRIAEVTDFLNKLGIEKKYYTFGEDGRLIIYMNHFDVRTFTEGFEDEIVLPDNMTVNGLFDLRGEEKIKSLSSGLKVMGRGLTMVGNKNIKELPPDLYIGGNLYIGLTNITEVPNTIHVSDEIYLKEPLKHDKELYRKLGRSPKWKDKIKIS